MELNKIFCAGTESTANTGMSDCPYTPAHIVGAILAPKDFSIAKADYATPAALYTYLNNATHAARAARVFPLPGFEELSGNEGGAPRIQTLGYGREIASGEDTIKWKFKYVDGGLCVHNNLRKFNEGKWGAFFIDANGVLIGTRDGDNMKAIPLDKFRANPWTASNGTDATTFEVEFSFKPKYINEDIAFLDADGVVDFTNLSGLLNVKLSAVVSAGDAKVSAVVSCGGTNLYDLYETELSQVSAWVLKDAAGASVTIDTVTASDSDKTWVLNSTTPVVAGFTVELAAPSVLNVAPINVSGYEGLKATVTV